MKVSMLLAEAAQAVDGKLYVLGGGWTITGPEPRPFAIALSIEIDPDQINTPQHLRLDMTDEHGEFVPGPEGGRLHIEVGFQYSPPPDAFPGAPMNAVFAFNLGSQPTIAPGGNYTWRLTLNGHHDPAWVLPFATRPAKRRSRRKLALR